MDFMQTEDRDAINCLYHQDSRFNHPFETISHHSPLLPSFHSMLTKGELEYIRPWVSIRLTAVLGGYNPTVIDAALDCIARSLNRQSTTDKLRTYLEHETQSFVDDLYRKVLEVKSSGIVKDIGGGKRESEDTDDYPPAKKKPSRFASPLSQNEVQAMLQSTRKQIEERRQQTQAIVKSTSKGPSTEVKTQGGGSFGVISDAVEKARKAAELQARIKNQLAAKPNLLLADMKDKTSALPSKPVPLVLDQEGKADLPMAVRAPTLIANIRAHQKNKFQKITQQNQKKDSEETVKNPYFDARVTQMGIGRGRKQFKFNEPGKYVKLGQTLRFKAQLEKLQSEIASSARKTGISSATKLALIAPTTEEKEDDIPLVEWWDADLLPNRNYGDCERDVPNENKYREITNLIEHPIPVQPVGVPTKPTVIPVMLTKKERKKIRKQRRRELELEKQEKIRFGFIDKPEPKIRISNLMRVLGTEAVQDPTKITAHVKAQMAERQRKHEESNASRKLTAEQKRAKKIKKLTEDTSTGVHVTVYRVADLSNQSIKFKVDMNAQQYYLTGRVLVYPGMNLVIVEGGPKALKKYKRLMLHRIKWNQRKKKGAAVVNEDDNSDNEGGPSDSSKGNKCIVVWEGIKDERSFSDWQFKQCSSESIAREHLKKYKSEHYWDMALSESIVEQEGDN